MDHWVCRNVMLFATLTTLQKVGIIVGVGVGIGGLLAAVMNVWLSVVNERKRTQPIVMTHQIGVRRFSERTHRFAVDVYITNEGSGAAFNVQFGVEFHGIRIPYKHASEDHRAGSVYRVLGPEKRLPSTASWVLELDPLLFLGRTEPDSTRMFWARYENAQGKLWETRNPGDRSKSLDIRRVRARRFLEWREGRRRGKALRQGVVLEQAAIDELLQQLPQDPSAE